MSASLSMLSGTCLALSVFEPNSRPGTDMGLTARFVKQEMKSHSEGAGPFSKSASLREVQVEYNLFALRLQNPEWIWSFQSSGVIGQPIIAVDCVYFANLHDSLFCLDLQTGTERFRVKTDVRSHFACGVGNGMLFMAGSMSEHRLMAFADQE